MNIIMMDPLFRIWCIDPRYISFYAYVQCIEGKLLYGFVPWFSHFSALNETLGGAWELSMHVSKGSPFVVMEHDNPNVLQR